MNPIPGLPEIMAATFEKHRMPPQAGRAPRISPGPSAEDISRWENDGGAPARKARDGGNSDSPRLRS